MAIEKKLIAAIFKDRKAYSTIRGLAAGTADTLFNELDFVLYQQAAEFYKEDPDADSVDFDVVESAVGREYPRQAKSILAALRLVQEADTVSSANIVKEFLLLKKQALSQELAGALLSNRGDTSELLDRYKQLDNASDVHQLEEMKAYESPRISDVARSNCTQRNSTTD
jgi:hypothetical protein